MLRWDATSEATEMPHRVRVAKQEGNIPDQDG